jgi:hypothetical protein
MYALLMLSILCLITKKKKSIFNYITSKIKYWYNSWLNVSTVIVNKIKSENRVNYRRYLKK